MMINKFDESMLYFKKDCKINDKIILKQPTINDIIEQGEMKYYSMIQTLTSIPSDVKFPLFEAGFDYEQVSNFELFIMQCKTLSVDDTKFILGDIDLSKFKTAQRTDNDEVVLYDVDNDIIIDRYIYQIIFEYACRLHDIHPKVERAGNAYTKKILIEEDRDKREKKQDAKPILLPLISFLANIRGCKASDLLDLGIYEFMDSIRRTELIKKIELTLSGVYAGTIDASKINKSDLDWKKTF